MKKKVRKQAKKTFRDITGSAMTKTEKAMMSKMLKDMRKKKKKKG